MNSSVKFDKNLQQICRQSTQIEANLRFFRFRRRKKKLLGAEKEFQKFGLLSKLKKSRLNILKFESRFFFIELTDFEDPINFRDRVDIFFKRWLLVNFWLRWKKKWRKKSPISDVKSLKSLLRLYLNCGFRKTAL